MSASENSVFGFGAVLKDKMPCDPEYSRALYQHALQYKARKPEVAIAALSLVLSHKIENPHVQQQRMSAKLLKELLANNK